MLIRNNTLTESANSILENATYLYESEMPNVSAYSIPVVANDRFNAGIVSYENISRFCENYGLDIIDGIRAVAEANNIDPNDVVVSIDESTIISDPWVVDGVHQYVVQPVSESNLVSQFTDIMVDSFLESGDDFYLQAIGEPELVLEADDDRAYADGNFVSSQDIKNQANDYREGMKKLKGMSTKVGDKTIKPDDPNFLVKIKRFLTDKPREYLARAVARLRQTYRKFLLRADKENDENKIKWYKQIARKILQAVDWVLNKIQKAASINYEKRANKYAMNYADKLKDAGYGKNTKGPESVTVNKGGKSETKKESPWGTRYTFDSGVSDEEKRNRVHNTRLENRIKNENPGGFGTRNTFDSGMSDSEKRAGKNRIELENRIKNENPGGFGTTRNTVTSELDKRKKLENRIKNENPGGFGTRHTF